MDVDRDPFSGFNAGGAVADADPEDMRKIWDLLESMPSDGKAVGMEFVKRACKPRGDFPAACYRTMIVGLLGKTEVLTRWKHDGKFDDAVFKVAATIPMKWMQPRHVYDGPPFDAEEFLRQVETLSG